MANSYMALKLHVIRWQILLIVTLISDKNGEMFTLDMKPCWRILSNIYTKILEEGLLNRMLQETFHREFNYKIKLVIYFGKLSIKYLHL